MNPIIHTSLRSADNGYLNADQTRDLIGAAGRCQNQEHKIAHKLASKQPENHDLIYAQIDQIDEVYEDYINNLKDRVIAFENTAALRLVKDMVNTELPILETLESKNSMEIDRLQDIANRHIFVRTIV